jgi:hypothetical protein
VLVQEVIRRFPVTGYGERNDRMCVAVSSLLGRGYSPEVTAAVLTAWLGHYRDWMRAEPEEAEGLLAACIQSTLNNPDFRPAMALMDHDRLCREITLSPLQRAFLHGIILPGQFPSADCQLQLPPDNQHQSLLLPCHLLLGGEDDGGAWMRARAWWADRLCRGVQERAFVEGWLVHCLHRVLHPQEEVIRATHDQARGIIRARYALERTTSSSPGSRLATSPGRADRPRGLNSSGSYARAAGPPMAASPRSMP